MTTENVEEAVSSENVGETLEVVVNENVIKTKDVSNLLRGKKQQLDTFDMSIDNSV